MQGGLPPTPTKQSNGPERPVTIELSGTWYHYCEIGQDTVASLLAAESMGRYYNASIKGKFDCRTHRVPDY
ncbi:KTSC domain-containing protein [Rhizobiales bacterium GAS191]|nr:KTSC domain-containing protein [Rhizobiales bacterium GAS191]